MADLGAVPEDELLEGEYDDLPEFANDENRRSTGRCGQASSRRSRPSSRRRRSGSRWWGI